MPQQAVSAIIPTHNRAHLVPRAIRSALAALAPGDEVVVIDDGSTDDTVAVVEAFGPPVRLLKLPHGGAGVARNAGVAAARGPLIAFLDSDDEWFPDKIALQREFLERRPDVVYCCSDFGVRLEGGAERHRCLPLWLSVTRPLAKAFGPGIPYSSVAPLTPGREDFPVYIGTMYREEMHHTFVATFTLMARKAETADALQFADDLPTCEEWPAFGRLTRCGPGALFDTETAWQHGHSGPRLTEAEMHVWAEAWLATLERVWGRDQEFLAEHGGEFRRAVTEARLIRACSLARHGDTHEARRALRLAAGDPVAFRNVWRRFSSKYNRLAREEIAERAKAGSWRG
jgi:glycosyltransferase involved in cell wall biosynthesis